MRHGLHVLHVVFEPEQVAEAEHGEHLDRRLLPADEFRFEPLQAEAPRDLRDLLDQPAGQAAAAVLRQDQHADPADVTLPTAQLLVQRGDADDLSVRAGKERKVSSEVDIVAPIADDCGLGDAMFDEHALGFRDGEEELVQLAFIVFAQRPQRALELIFEHDLLRELLQFEFE